ncbi:hypothetical protein CDD81_7249 [Ophiocordyceps australis]|uniref:Aminodeoxychorismate lyase n=1 Tax=Ophiocordyceps australis TaxID=1399860 RepID=A0A2C5X934_9HYPO|nr:hypothetical protein CDD81_7249 [Ophiocordyceps australis]
MLDLHRDRLLRAAIYWNWQAAIDLLSGDAGLEALSQMARVYLATAKTTPKRLRVMIDSLGTVSFAQFDTPLMPLNNLFPQCLPSPASTPTHHEPCASPRFTLVVDTCHTDRSEFTHYKTTVRDVYNDARQRVGIQQADLKEVLIINTKDQTVIEGSLTTPYFWRRGQWVTPPVSGFYSQQNGCGGQDGTSRRWALQRNLAVEQSVPISSLVDGEECWISNGVSGFRRATLSLTTSPEANATRT